MLSNCRWPGRGSLRTAGLAMACPVGMALAGLPTAMASSVKACRATAHRKRAPISQASNCFGRYRDATSRASKRFRSAKRFISRHCTNDERSPSAAERTAQMMRLLARLAATAVCRRHADSASAIRCTRAAVAHRAAYDPITARSFTVDTPGPCSSNLRRLPYKHLRGSA